MFDKDWRNARAPQFGTYMKSHQNTNADAAKVIGGRWLWDNVLSDELPWVGQKFEFAPAHQALPHPYAPKYNLQFLKSDNTGATPPMNANELQQWMAQAQ
jgi:hypothetical protein